MLKGKNEYPRFKANKGSYLSDLVNSNLMRVEDFRKSIKSETFDKDYKIISFTNYKGCVFYFEGVIPPFQDVLFDNCSFRTNLEFMAVSCCKFTNCNFSGRVEVGTKLQGCRVAGSFIADIINQLPQVDYVYFQCTLIDADAGPFDVRKSTLFYMLLPEVRDQPWLLQIPLGERGQFVFQHNCNVVQPNDQWKTMEVVMVPVDCTINEIVIYLVDRIMRPPLYLLHVQLTTGTLVEILACNIPTLLRSLAKFTNIHTVGKHNGER